MYKLQKCIETKRVNNSRSRELIYKILCETSECLSVSDILKQVHNEYPKKISLNTAYRHLRFLMDCELVFTIQDDLKKAYYCLCRDEVDVFEICPKCSKIQKVNIPICEIMKASDFITVHKKCAVCQ